MQKMFRIVLFSFIASIISTALFAAPEPQRLESRDLTMIVEKTGEPGNEGIRLVSLTDKRTGHVFCSAPSRPLFSLVIRTISDKKEHYLLADGGWNAVRTERKDEVLHLSWKGTKRIDGAENVVVEMRIVADPEKDGIEISQTAAAGSDRISIMHIRLGQVAVKNFGDDTKVFTPRASGLVTENPCEKRFVWQMPYPGFNCAMPWLVVWKEKTPEAGFRSRDNLGLYVGFHDVKGSRKAVMCMARPKQEKNYHWPDTVSFWSQISAENCGKPNNRLDVGGKAVLRSVRNDWQDGAAIYRDWVRKEASWYPREKMDENGRTDTPRWFKEHCLWAMYRVAPDEMVRAMKKMQEAFDLPAAVHWYYWQNNPFDFPNPHDNDYPHFFPRPGFVETVTKMQEDGKIHVMPYINGLLWDMRDRNMEDWRYTKEGSPLAVKREDGGVAPHSYGSKENDGSNVIFANMCPATEGWQRKVRENVLRLLNECGTSTVYIDQVAAATPNLCFDPTHGHPLGGGHWWNDGYRKMFEIIRSDMRREVGDHPLCDAVKQRIQKNPNALAERVLTTECTGETSLCIFDGFLTWHHQVNGQVPAFAAVYGGSIQMIGRDYRAGITYAERTAPTMPKTNSPLACRMKTGEALCFGEQLGWFVPTIVDEADKFPFQRKAVRLRHQVRHYFYKGEMCRVPEFPAEMPTVTADWNFFGTSMHTAPAIRTGCWRILKNGKTESAILLFANTSDEEITLPVRVDLAEIGFGDVAGLKIRQIGPEGTEKEIGIEAVTQPIVFPAEGVFAWEITRR